MVRLFLVEVRRLVSRRSMHLLGAIVLLGMIVLNGVQFAQAEARTGDTEARVRAAVTAERERIRNTYELDRAHFEAAKQRGEVPSDAVYPPLAEQLANVDEHSVYVEDRSYPMSRASGQVLAAGLAVVALAFAVGATFAGAEWAAGTMQGLLFWEPRRLRVVTAKLLALGVVVLAAVVLAQLLQLGLSFATASLRGHFDGLSDNFYTGLGAKSLRVAVLGVFSSWVAFGIAGLTRNTGGALGVGFVYFAILENVVRAARPRWQPYLVTNQFAAWVEKKFAIPMPAELRNGEYFETPPFVLTMNRAGLTLLVYLLAVVGTMTVLFVRRDVT